jgi:hypothetical protein
MNRQINALRRFLWESAFYAIMFVTVTFTVFTVGPWLESRVFPVVGKLVILRAEPTPSGGTLIYAAFSKKRDCEYVGISWHRRLPDGSIERLPITLHRAAGDVSSPNRPVGSTVAGPWELPVPFDELKADTFALLQHRCHSFWITTTEFFP